MTKTKKTKKQNKKTAKETVMVAVRTPPIGWCWRTVSTTKKMERESARDKEAGEEEEEEDLGDLGRELVRKVGFHLLTRGIGVGVTLLTSVVHMPLCTITNSILSSPHAYTGPIDCAQQVLAAEGWQGFYKVGPVLTHPLTPRLP
jgi:hypothetical protein